MAADPARMVSVLDEKSILLLRLEEVLTLEQKAIVSLDLSGLEQIDQQKRHLLMQIETNGNEFRQLLKVQAEAAGLPMTVTLTPLLPTLPLAEREQATALQHRMKEQGRRVDRLLDLNRELLQNSLKTVNSSIDFFNRLFTQGATYGGAGRMANDGTGVRLVSREA